MANTIQTLEDIALHLRKSAFLQEEALRHQERQLEAQNNANLIAFYHAIKLPNAGTSPQVKSTVAYLEEDLARRLKL